MTKMMMVMKIDARCVMSGTQAGVLAVAVVADIGGVLFCCCSSCLFRFLFRYVSKDVLYTASTFAGVCAYDNIEVTKGSILRNTVGGLKYLSGILLMNPRLIFVFQIGHHRRPCSVKCRGSDY